MFAAFSDSVIEENTTSEHESSSQSISEHCSDVSRTLDKLQSCFSMTNEANQINNNTSDSSSKAKTRKRKQVEHSEEIIEPTKFEYILMVHV